MSESRIAPTESRRGLADARLLVQELALRDTFWPAFQALIDLGPVAIPAVREGLGDGRWQIRRWCAAFLDHYGGPESRPWLLPLLHDPKSKVRLMAVHTLACDRCAGGENPIDAVPHLVDRLWYDEGEALGPTGPWVLRRVNPPGGQSLRVIRPSTAGLTGELAIR